MSPRMVTRGSVRAQMGVVEALPASDLALVFDDWVDLSVVAQGCFRNRLFTPTRTFWLFLSQVFSAGGSCQEAVDRALAWLAVERGEVASTNTAAYCQARKRLDAQFVQEVGQQLRERLGSLPAPYGLWQGRAVKVLDGSSVSLTDTPDNQAAYPQPSGQRAGCGFPVMRLACMFALSSGALVGCESGPLKVAERTLARRLWEHLDPGDVALGDRGFCSFAEFFMLRQRGVDSVARLHAQRGQGVRELTRLGRGDQLVEWIRTRKGPDWLTDQQWDAMPKTLTVRHVSFAVAIKGFRTQRITVATTLCDAKLYPKGALSDLYRRRWLAELFLRDIKTTLAMEPLRTKTPDMVAKELAMHLIAYNLLRALMLQAACEYPIQPTRLSFANALATVRMWTPFMLTLHYEQRHREGLELLLYYLATTVVPSRPGRSEPRAVKRRPKNYQRLTKPRSDFKEIKHRNRYRKALS